MKKCNGTGLVLKRCETKNNVWKRCKLSIQNSIGNCIEITTIKPNSASLNNVYEPRNAAVSYTHLYLNGHLIHETRGEKTFEYCYDANCQLYAVSYKANSSTDAVTYYYRCV